SCSLRLGWLALHRLPNGEVSTPWHRQPGGEYVLCGVHVSVVLVAAGLAPEHRLALTVVRRAVPAGVAGLRRERWRHPQNLGAVVSSFVFQGGQQSAPSLGQYRPVQRGFLPDVLPRLGNCAFGGGGHVSDVEVFHDDQSVIVGEAVGGPRQEVGTPGADAGVQLGQLRPGGLTPVGALLLPGELLLKPLEPRRLPWGDEFAVSRPPGRGGDCAGDPKINPYRWFAVRCGLHQPVFDDEGDVPAPAVLAHGGIANLPAKRSCPPEAGPAQLGQLDSAPATGD